MNYVASPSVRAYAGRKGVDLDRVAEKFGRELIGREDVDQFLTGGGAKPAPSANSTDHTQFWDVDHAQFGPIREEPMSRFAQVSAQNLAAANAMIPQVTHHDRADMSAVEAFRQSIKAEMVQKGVKLTALAFHLKALAATLKAFPKFNASLSPDGKTLVLKQYVHIGVAVDTPYGLLVPVVRDVDQKGVIQIANDIADIAGRAQARKIRPDELAGASMAVSSLGGIGGIGFTPIVNPPQLAILGISRAEIVPRWDGANWQPVPMLPLDLSYDHRVINGAEAARFVVHFIGLLETPKRLL